MQSASQPSTGTLTEDPPNTILRVIVDNMLYPVTLDTLHVV